LSGGGSFSLTSHCQIGQSLLQYVLLGWLFELCFKTSKKNSKQTQNKWSWFLMDFPFFSRLVDYKFNLWRAVTSTEL
jgi:hypothetical protein